MPRFVHQILWETPITSRRDFLIASGAGTLAYTLPLRAQSTPRVVWVSPTPEAESKVFFDALREGMRDFGYVDGKNIVLAARYSDGSPDSTFRVVQETLESRPTVMVSQGSVGPLARKANPTLPVVFGYSGDPVAAGMVEALARPGGLMTGITYMNAELIGKRMEILKELLPAAKRVAIVASPDHFGDLAERQVTQQVASKLGVNPEIFEIRAGVKLPELLSLVEKARVNAALFFPTQSVIANRQTIAAWSLKTRTPTISGWSAFADGGNIMSYGPNLSEASRRLAYFIDRILKGAKPSELPVELPNRVEFVINQKVAKALGIVIPPALLVRADRVIE